MLATRLILMRSPCQFRRDTEAITCGCQARTQGYVIAHHRESDSETLTLNQKSAVLMISKGRGVSNVL